MLCCRCDASDRWMDFCDICGLTQCPACAERGCCGRVPMQSGSFGGPTELPPKMRAGAEPVWPTTYGEFRELGAKPLQALACLYGPRPLTTLRGSESWETMVRMHDAGLLREVA